MAIGGAFMARTSAAGPWSIEPRVGVTVDYSTNPLLREFDGRSEEHVAGLLDLPVRYDTDAVEFLLRPSGRLSNSRGYSSLASNYLHVDADLQSTSELGVTTLQGGLARDSSLYYAGGLVNGVGVRRDTGSGGVDWLRSLTERTQLDVNAAWTELRYAQTAAFSYFTDYRYLSAGPTWSWNATERDTLKILGSAGRYQSLNGITESRSVNLQAGYSRHLTEIWSLDTSAGYSRSKNSEKFYFGPFYLGTLASNQEGTVYSATIARHGETVNLTGTVSRSLQPTGFAYLSRQTSASVSVAYIPSEKWDYSLSGAWQKAQIPIVGGGLGRPGGPTATVKYLNAQLSANWHWTAQWVLSMHATRISDEYGPPTLSGASTNFSVDLTRQFLRTQFP
jgi:hypothetical protein